ncbi:hypothetical protein [Gracilimonas mengyeensis]|uniref:Uncharacterized protein n=1 Tax=Gracilimonas mengyeensis TaxID=1302730 RepID=A0A521FKN2_9BACT|nr:hypothetical protein [Gracilimonas mengyeensis]SMO96763.1 hypothetical protein SAMN06265219_12137 [Gracilimonas mengyeensis]
MQSRLLFIISIYCSLHFFGLYHRLGGRTTFILIDAIGFALILLILIAGRNKINKANQRFYTPLIILFFFLFLSAVSCLWFHSQSMIATFISMRYWGFLALYFVYHKLNLEKKWLEKFIIYSCLIYIGIFYLQFILFPFDIVPLGRIDSFDRGLLRIRIEGAGFLMLAGFLSLNRFLVYGKKRRLLFYFICLVTLFMLGFRTFLATSIITSIYLIIRVSNNSVLLLRNIAITFIIGYMVYSVPTVNEFIEDMFVRTSSQIEQEENYIRIQTFYFFSEQVNVNEFSLIFGNGFPQEDSSYGKFVYNRGVQDQGFIFADIGLIGFTFIYGLLSLFLFLYLFIKGIFIKTNRQDVYLSAYLLYLIISSITTVEIYRTGMFGIEALVFYLIDKSTYKRSIK